MERADLHDQCNADGIPANDFATLCQVCRNPECSRAGAIASPWTQRMQDQVDRLLVNPHFADHKDPKYAKLGDIPTIEPQPEWPSPDKPRPTNTTVPQGGIMVGGGPIPPKEPAPDPWAVPKKPKNMVKVGATVSLGKKGSG